MDNVWGLRSYNEHGSGYRTDYYQTQGEAATAVYRNSGGYSGQPFVCTRAEAVDHATNAQVVSDVCNQAVLHF